MVERRDVLKAGLGALAASIASARAEPAAPSPAAPTFTRESVLETARALAKKPYAPPANDLREPFASLTYEQYAAIKMKPGAEIWFGEQKGFTIEPLHRGSIFSAPVDLYVVDAGAMKRVSYDSAFFDYGGLKVPEKVGDIGFSGFRVLRAQNEGEAAELALFQGASLYRASAAGQPWGVSARGLSIRTADPHGEEFPAFRVFWIEKPALGDNTLIVHALLESPSVVGAYRFTLRPGGEATIVDTELTLFPRVDLDHIGIGTIAGVSLFTPLDRRRTEDVRVAVTELNGLQMLTGNDEWLWRPVSNRNELQISSFVDQNPKGFGALMRDRSIESYEDDEQHWERRPSLWIEPLGDWGEGSVQLIEIPSESEVNQNVFAYWRPKQVLTNIKPASFAYRQFWCWTPPTRPPSAYVTQGRSGRGSMPKQRRFVVAFAGNILGDAARAGAIRPVLTTSPGSATNVRAYPAPQSKTYRVSFDLDPGSETFCEMRLVLQSGDQTISETWLYRWTA